MYIIQLAWKYENTYFNVFQNYTFCFQGRSVKLLINSVFLTFTCSYVHLILDNFYTFLLILISVRIRVSHVVDVEGTPWRRRTHPESIEKLSSEWTWGRDY